MRGSLLLTIIFFFSLLEQLAHTDEISYHPINLGFWETVNLALKDKDYKDILPLADDVSKHTKKDSQENGEAQLATGLALKGLGFKYLSTQVLGEVLKKSLGTDIGLQALLGLEEIAHSGLVDEDYVYGELANDLEFDTLPKGLSDFISYQQGIFDLLHGFDKWSALSFSKINSDSYWDFKLRYYYALKDVAADNPSGALEKFSKLASSDLVPDDIKGQAVHQQARLIFEKGDYTQAYKLYKKVTLSPREKGLILLERAWAKYYQKDYGKALGLLVALEAPYFDASRTPEAYILKMLMYKELCYYDSALSVVGEFNKHFRNSIQNIHKRTELRSDQVLVNLSVLDQGVERWVNFLQSLKDEKKDLENYNWEQYAFLKNSRRLYDLEMNRVRNQLDWILKDKVRKSANQLLDWEEQLTFLDYQTRLDRLRVIKPKSEVPYRSEEISHTKFDKSYWTAEGEIWFDELEDYKVFVESQCEEDVKVK